MKNCWTCQAKISKYFHILLRELFCKMYSISKSTLLPDVLDQTQIHLLYSQINNNATYNIIICTHLFSGVNKMSCAKNCLFCLENHSSLLFTTFHLSKKVNFLVAS